jgi:hypothetical protein
METITRKPTKPVKESSEARERRFKKMGKVGNEILWHIAKAQELRKLEHEAWLDNLDKAEKAYADEAKKHEAEAMRLWGVDCGK